MTLVVLAMIIAINANAQVRPATIPATAVYGGAFVGTDGQTYDIWTTPDGQPYHVCRACTPAPTPAPAPIVVAPAPINVSNINNNVDREIELLKLQQEASFRQQELDLAKKGLKLQKTATALNFITGAAGATGQLLTGVAGMQGRLGTKVTQNTNVFSQNTPVVQPNNGPWTGGTADPSTLPLNTGQPWTGGTTIPETNSIWSGTQTNPFTNNGNGGPKTFGTRPQ